MSNANTATYRTIQGDRFTWISYKFYGSSRFASVLMRTNPTQAGVVLFDAGVMLTIPQMTVQQNVSQTSWGTFFQTS